MKYLPYVINNSVDEFRVFKNVLFSNCGGVAGSCLFSRNFPNIRFCIKNCWFWTTKWHFSNKKPPRGPQLGARCGGARSLRSLACLLLDGGYCWCCWCSCLLLCLVVGVMAWLVLLLLGGGGDGDNDVSVVVDLVGSCCSCTNNKHHHPTPTAKTTATTAINSTTNNTKQHQ